MTKAALVKTTASPFRVVNHRLEGPGVVHIDTKKKSGKADLKFMIMHYTASGNFKADVATLSTSDRPASCQIVLGPEGELCQIGLLNDALWQAGKSSWRGFVGLNKHSLGIEVTSPGWLTGERGAKTAKDYTGKVWTDGKPFPFVWARHESGGPERFWAGYTDRQIELIKQFCPVIVEHYGLREVVGHDDIAPGRKIDPGPCCPQQLFDFLNGDAKDEDGPERDELTSVGLGKVSGLPQGETLTFRASPNGEKRGELVEGQEVEVLGVEGNWFQVRTPAGYVGYVWASFVHRT